MIEQDTVKLLRECDAGVKMGVASIDDVMPHVQRPQLQSVLNKCKDEHSKLQNEILEQLGKYGDEGKNPNLGGGLCVGRLWHWRNYGSTGDG